MRGGPAVGRIRLRKRDSLRFGRRMSMKPRDRCRLCALRSGLRSLREYAGFPSAESIERRR